MTFTLIEMLDWHRLRCGLLIVATATLASCGPSEPVAVLKPGTKTLAWTNNGSVPGPLIRGRVGDRLIVHFKNSLPA